MTVNQAWRDAMTEAGRAFNHEEQKAGWPQTMTPWQLASLQRPFANGDIKGRTSCHALFHGIEDDCKAGAIQITAEAKEKVTPGRFIETASSGPNWTAGRWGFDSARTGHYKPPTVRQWTEYRITAITFVEWLAAQEIEPSRHVAAWFKSQGVTTAKATPVPAPAAQVEPVPERSAPDSPPPRILKKIALIRELEHEWPTIERDLSEASRNGLSEAKADKHGYWDADKARQWADSNGKLKKSAQVYRAPATFGSQFEQLTR